MFRVLYRPLVVAALKKDAAAFVAEESGPGRVFKGRAGCFRHYQSDIFVNKKGTWAFIQPIPGPDGTIPTRVKVVKPALLTARAFSPADAGFVVPRADGEPIKNVPFPYDAAA